MVVPHGAGKPRQIELHISVIFLVLVGWTSITFLGTYLSAQRIDYWRSQISNQVLKMKVKYLMSEIDRSRGFLDEVKQIEVSLREMLHLNNEAKNAGRKTHKKKAKLATGGPSLDEQNDITQILTKITPDLTWRRVVEKVSLFKSEARTRVSSYDRLSDWLIGQRRLYLAKPQGWPCPGRRTSHFGKRLDPFNGTEMFHFGVDIAGPTGTPIRATADGTVRMASWQSGYGKLVVLQHDFGYSSRYAHNYKILVRVGDKIKRGQIISLMGDTGKSSGTHCHYEVWKNNNRKNPYAFMIGGGVRYQRIIPVARRKITFKNRLNGGLMFSFKTTHSKLEAIIGPETEVEGSIRTSQSIRVDGKIKGGVNAESVVIGPNGVVLGDISANHVTVGGRIKGNISAVTLLDLLQTGQILGDIKTNKLIIADGASFEGIF